MSSQPVSNGSCDVDGLDARTASRFDELFQSARRLPPTSDQLEHFLRAVPRSPRHGAGQAHYQIRRIVWRICGGAAAIAAIIAIVAGILGPGSTHPTFAMSMVLPAMRNVEVIHAIHNGVEWWEMPGEFSALRWADDKESVHYFNIPLEEYATYNAVRGCIVLTTCEPTHAHLDGLPTLKTLVADLEAIGDRLDRDWTRRDVYRDGRAVVEYTPNAPRDCAAMVFDAASGRLIERKDSSGSTRFDYPPAGPRNIYDMGVPRDAPLVDGRASQELLQLRLTALQHWAPTFGPYLSVVVTYGQQAYLVLSDGERRRIETYDFRDTPAQSLDEQVTIASQFLAGEVRGRCTEVEIVNGAVATRVRLDEQGRPGPPAKFDSLLAHYGLVLEESDEFFNYAPDRLYEYLGMNDAGWFGYQSLSQPNLSLFHDDRPVLAEMWFDPAHNYRQCSMTVLQIHESQWQLCADGGDTFENELHGGRGIGHEFRVIEWAELRPGQWYPAITETQSMVRSFDAKAPTLEELGEEASPPNYQVVAAIPLEGIDDHEFEFFFE